MQRITKVGRNIKITFDDTLLKSLIEGINKNLVVRVGVLGVKGRRQEQGVSNADIGLAHEKGVKSRNLPRRSWLEQPLQDHLKEQFEALGKKAIESMLQAKSEVVYAQLGLVAENVIQRGFETGGYGKWKPLKQSTIRAKGSDAILIDTAQLRRSITSEVVSR